MRLHLASDVACNTIPEMDGTEISEIFHCISIPVEFLREGVWILLYEAISNTHNVLWLHSHLLYLPFTYYNIRIFIYTVVGEL